MQRWAAFIFPKCGMSALSKEALSRLIQPFSNKGKVMVSIKHSVKLHKTPTENVSVLGLQTMGKTHKTKNTPALLVQQNLIKGYWPYSTVFNFMGPTKAKIEFHMQSVYSYV